MPHDQRSRSPLYEDVLQGRGGLAGGRFVFDPDLQITAYTASYLDLPGTAGSYASTPDNSAVSITGDIDIRARITLTDWTPNAASFTIAAKWTESTNQRSYVFQIQGAGNGNLMFFWSTTGTDTPGEISTSSTGFIHGSTHWVRVTLDVNDGAGNYVVRFYTSENGSAWTQLGTTITTAGATSIFDGTAILEIGSHSIGTAQQFNGMVYYADVRNGIDGTEVAEFDPSETTINKSSFTSSTGEVWTMNGTAVLR